MRFEKLREEITKDMSMSKMANKIGMSRQCFYYKMKFGSFTFHEQNKIIKILSRINGRKYTAEELFWECD